MEDGEGLGDVGEAIEAAPKDGRGGKIVVDEWAVEAGDTNDDHPADQCLEQPLIT